MFFFSNYKSFFFVIDFISPPAGLPILSLQTKSLLGQPWLWMSHFSEEGR